MNTQFTDWYLIGDSLGTLKPYSYRSHATNLRLTSRPLHPAFPESISARRHREGGSPKPHPTAAGNQESAGIRKHHTYFYSLFVGKSGGELEL